MARQLAYRFGQSAGRAWRSLDRLVMNGLAAIGLPAGAAKALLWSIKFIVLVGLLYVAFWLAVVGIGIAVAVWNGRHPLHDVDMEGWRHGDQGVGLYDKNGLRVDSAYSCNPEN